jgi:hypothetical protein
MPLTRILAGATLALTGFSAVASGLPEGWSEPTVAHDGIRVISADHERMESRFYFQPPGKQREDMTREGMTVSVIVRQDLDRAWTILPGGLFMEMSLEDSLAETSYSASSEGVVDYEKVGTETIDGWATTRYRVVMLEDGEETQGYFWFTEHWIPIRMEMHLANDPSEALRMEVRELKIRAQDPSLFELPPGAVPMPAFGGMGGDAGIDFPDLFGGDDDEDGDD